MLTQSQVDLLETFIGPNGIYSESVMESKCINRGTKILYLERAINEECFTFLNSLDLLYAEQSDQYRDLVINLKHINDLCFNNDMIYVTPYTRTSKKTLKHFFSFFDSMNIDDFQDKIKSLVNDIIANLLQKDTASLLEEKEARMKIEAELSPNNHWRNLADFLPPDQKERTQHNDQHLQTTESTTMTLRRGVVGISLFASPFMLFSIYNQQRRLALHSERIQNEYRTEANMLFQYRNDTLPPTIYPFEQLRQSYRSETLSVTEHQSDLSSTERSLNNNEDPSNTVSDLELNDELSFHLLR
ncbi:hypothetical protein EBR43_08050 [bacterium]|nr:hypothetical protein [bacterium]